jgi:glycosyltransferase involved in cell wall biosynthesis
VLIEAMACGTPVVSTDCPTGPAEILVGSAARNLVPPEDPIALAEALDRVLAAGAGSASAGDLDRFSPDRVARNYLDVLRPRPDGVNA